MTRIVDKLAPFFNRRDDKELEIVTNSIDEELHQLYMSVNKFMLECFINTAHGRWLDEWGSWFAVKRLPEEDDDTYRARILISLDRPKITVPSLVKVIEQSTGDEILVQIFEPFNYLKEFNKSTFSGKDRFRENDYWRHGVIDIKTSKELTPELQKMIDNMRGAGIKVHYSSIPKGIVTDLGDWIMTLDADRISVCGDFNK